MFNPKIYEWASEIVDRGDDTALANRVYRQIVAEAKLNRLAKDESRRTMRAGGRVARVRVRKFKSAWATRR